MCENIKGKKKEEIGKNQEEWKKGNRRERKKGKRKGRGKKERKKGTLRTLRNRLVSLRSSNGYQIANRDRE